MSKEFNTFGKITFEFEVDTEANTIEEAEQQVKEILNDYYHLKTKGAYHDVNGVEIKIIDTGEYE